MTSSFPARTFWLYLNIDVFPAAGARYPGLLITSSNYGTKTFRPVSYTVAEGAETRRDPTRLQSPSSF